MPSLLTDLSTENGFTALDCKFCRTRIAEPHQTPQEPRADAKAVRNCVTSSSRHSFHTTAKEPPVNAANPSYPVQQGKREGQLKGIG
ncbi:unnamed protein product [Rangifer tarandus platyrhynchus]|uniref:Uncharacterized protein n=1 Tax=Rangifer tarandus platyrhynchus TaxID=3082113 RepID=A0AC59YAZ9_RANTA